MRITFFPEIRMGWIFVLFVLPFITGRPMFAQGSTDPSLQSESPPCCVIDKIPGVVWTGEERWLPLEEIAAYCAPIVWLSPDEPLIHDQRGKDLRVPEPFGFEAPADRPVVYYRVRNILLTSSTVGDSAERAGTERGQISVDLDNVQGFDLDYFFYYSMEAGLNSHPHDIEPVEMKVEVVRNGDPGCTGCRYGIVVREVIAKAHGLLWYDNILIVDDLTRFPVTILVEEGKHANCTDKNGDGYFTPGYDVSVNANDAWGVRDIISGGPLFTGYWESWMAKVRSREDRAFPPLPPASPHRARYTRNGVYSPDNAVYELRPYPRPGEASEDVREQVAAKGYPDWPYLEVVDGADRLKDWLDLEAFTTTFSTSYRVDRGVGGATFVFPLLFLRNVHEPFSGGWLVNRVYWTTGYRDFAWTVLYTPSASRWFDQYLAAGAEWDRGDDGRRKAYFVSEVGLKIRVNLKFTPLKFLTVFRDFWGFRLGMKMRGFNELKDLGYVFEIGAGVF